MDWDSPAICKGYFDDDDMVKKPFKNEINIKCPMKILIQSIIPKLMFGETSKKQILVNNDYFPLKDEYFNISSIGMIVNDEILHSYDGDIWSY